MNKIIAHKGGAYDYPENSKEAILKSYSSKNCDGTEIDIRMTKDKVLVVMHDCDAFRTGNKLKLIKNCTYSEIKDLKVQHHRFDWYKYLLQNLLSTDLKNNKVNIKKLLKVWRQKSSLMTLKQALELLPDQHELIIEYKGKNEDYDNQKTYQKVILDTVSPYANKNIKLKGFDPNIGLYLKGNNPNLQVGILVQDNCIDNIKYPFDFVSLKFNTLLNHPELFKECTNYEGSKRELYLWTLDRYKEFVKLSNMFISSDKLPNIITNNVDVIKLLSEVRKIDSEFLNQSLSIDKLSNLSKCKKLTK